MSPATSESLYLCLDQGGHASRALVFDANGQVVAKSVQDVHTQHPHPDWVEHEPMELVASIQAAVADVVQQLGAVAECVYRAGLATQRSSIVCWDRRTGKPLSPVISWQDRRAQKWLENFSGHAHEIHQRTGLRLSPHYGASKMRWCLEHLPAVMAARDNRTLAMGPLVSFLLFHLLEENPFFADPANAARTLLWNIHALDWDPWLLELFGVPAGALPRCVPTRHAFGTLRANEHRIPLTIATGDQSAALFALGQPSPDTLYINIGTGAFIQRVFEQSPDIAGLLRGVAYRDVNRGFHVLEGTVNGAGAALNWAEQEFGLKDIEAQLSTWLARDVTPPLFLNGVAGLGAPFWVANFVSRLIGDGEPWQKAVAWPSPFCFCCRPISRPCKKFLQRPGAFSLPVACLGSMGCVSDCRT